MSSSNHLRKFSTTFYQDRGASDVAQVPASGKSIYVYRQGATVLGSWTITNAVGGITISVTSVGHLQVGDTVYKNNNSGTSMNVESITDDTYINLRSSGVSVGLASGDRLIITNSPPTLYSESHGQRTTANPAITDSHGLVEFYTPETMFDIVVDGTVYANNISGWIRGGGSYVNASDYATIQAAVDALPTGLRGTVFLPAGTYPITSTIHTNASNTHFLGERGFTTITCSNPSINMLDIKHFACSVENIQFTGPNSAGSGIGINCYAASASMSNIRIEGCSIDSTASWNFSASADTNFAVYFLTIDNCNFLNAKSGGSCRIGDVAKGGSVTSTWFSRCHFHGPGSQSTFGTTPLQVGSVHFYGATGCTFHRCYWEQFESSACLSFDGQCNVITVDSSTFEMTVSLGDNGHYMIQNGGILSNLSVLNCFISRIGTATYGIKFFRNEVNHFIRGSAFSNNQFYTSYIAGTPTAPPEGPDISLANSTDELLLNHDKQDLTTGASRKLSISTQNGVSVFGQRPEWRFKIPGVSGTAAITGPMNGDIIWVTGGSPGLYCYTTAWIGPLS
jgi:hypothetical protein